jgi:hypothetical protein
VRKVALGGAVAAQHLEQFAGHIAPDHDLRVDHHMDRAVLPGLLALAGPARRAGFVPDGAVSPVFTDPVTASGFLSTLGTLGVVVMYAVTNLALAVAWVRDRRRERGHVVTQFLLPLVGIAVLIIPVWGDLQPGQAAPYKYLPWCTIALAAVAVVYMLGLRARKPEVMADDGVLEDVALVGNPRRGGEQLTGKGSALAGMGPSSRVRGAGGRHGAGLQPCGTIPQVRGAEPGQAHPGGVRGTIPAGAGSSCRRPLTFTPTRTAGGGRRRGRP